MHVRRTVDPVRGAQQRRRGDGLPVARQLPGLCALGAWPAKPGRVCAAPPAGAGPDRHRQTACRCPLPGGGDDARSGRHRRPARPLVRPTRPACNWQAPGQHGVNPCSRAADRPLVLLASGGRAMRTSGTPGQPTDGGQPALPTTPRAEGRHRPRGRHQRRPSRYLPGRPDRDGHPRPAWWAPHTVRLGRRTGAAPAPRAPAAAAQRRQQRGAKPLSNSTPRGWLSLVLPGHAIVGRVAALDPGVSGLQLGQRVGDVDAFTRLADHAAQAVARWSCRSTCLGATPTRSSNPT